MLRGRLKGRRGWIAGDIDNLHPLVTRAIVHVGLDAEIIDLAAIRRDDQPELWTNKNAAG